MCSMARGIVNAIVAANRYPMAWLAAIPRARWLYLRISEGKEKAKRILQDKVSAMFAFSNVSDI